MSNYAFVFPGQGSQYVGMGRDWFEQTAAGREMFAQADDILGRPLSRICFEGPEDELQQTGNTQPALYVHSTIVATALKQRGVEPAIVAGHSLGSYSALFAAGALDFATGLRLVEQRGAFMAEAARANHGAMAAILGLELEPLSAICAGVAGVCVPANLNAPGQIVISGELAAVEAAVERAKAAGARRALLLPVHGAFHSPLMDGAAAKMAAALARAPIGAPAAKFINNAEAQVVTEPEAIRAALGRQITSPVRWIETMQRILALQPDAIIEAGSGKVLCGLFKRMNPDCPLLNCDKVEDLQRLPAIP